MPKHVLILRGEAPDLPGGRILADAIVSTVRGSFPGPTEFYIEAIDTGRFSGPAYEQRLVDFFAEKFRGLHLDLVVALSDPAVEFVTRRRRTLFPDSPLLFGLVERRVTGPAIPADAGVVYVEIDPAATARLAHRLYPAATRLLVVGGSSRFDRGWQAVVASDMRASASGMTVEYDLESPLERLRRKVAGLSTDTIVLYTSMTRDGAGVTARPIVALETLRQSARVPIFGISSTYLGHGIVGGILLDFDKHGQDLGERAVRMLRGERPPVLTTPGVARADWRELRRFKIPDASVPADVAVAFREPTLWESQKRTLGAVAIIVAVESALIVALVTLGNRRSETQRLLEARLRFERWLSNLSVSLATSPPEQIDETLHAALRSIAEDVGADAVWMWESGEDGDDWESPELRAGHQAEFASAARLPRRVRERVVETPGLPCSCLAVPLGTAGVMSGALFWMSYGAVARWNTHADKLRVVGAVVAAVLQGKRAEAALERSDRLKGAILDSLPAHVAVLDRQGFIIGVNDAWTVAEHAGGLPAGRSIEPGSNYLDACAAASRAGVSGTAEALLLLRLACGGERSGRQIEYACEVAGEERWFLMTVEPLRRADGGAVVTHSDITARKLNEIALRESENRFRSAEQRLRDLNRRLIAAQEEERRRIARELHDHLNQQLALLAIELQQLSLDPPASADEVTAALHEEWRRTTEIASDVHAISHRLHPSKLESLGLVATVRAHCRDLSRKSLTTNFTEQGMPPRIPADTALCLFRVAEEALSNVAKHSGATEAFVTLLGTGSDVVLRVADNGSGFDDGGIRGEGLGLVSMRERVQALGGTFGITSVPGKGTVVEARVACPQASAARRGSELAGRRAESA